MAVKREKMKVPSEIKRGEALITGRHIFLLLVLAFSAVAAAAFLFVPDKFQLPMILAIPAMVVGIYIIINPYAGIYLFFLYDTLRPYDFIYALRPLRLALVIEGVTLISWFVYLIRSKTRINWPAFNWPFLGFLALIILSVFTAENRGLAMNVFNVMIVSFIIFVISTNTVDSRSRLNKLIWLLLIIHFYFALKGIHNYFFGAALPNGQRTSGIVGSSFLGDENDFALVINIFIPMAFFMFMGLKNRVSKLISGIFLVTFVFAIISSFSRGGWVGLMAAVAYCIMNSKRKLMSISIALMLFLLLLAVAPSSYWSEIETISDTSENTADARIRYWHAAVKIFADHPILGVGAGNGGIYLPYYISGAINPDREWGRAFHGTLPQVLAESGIVGFSFYILMAFYAIKSLWFIRKRKSTGRNSMSREVIANGLLGGIITYFVTATFISTVYYPQLWTLYTLTFVLVFIDKSESKEELSASPAAVPSTS
jgi:probable O-glycosylation ligase (exosortase A-associated)